MTRLDVILSLLLSFPVYEGDRGDSPEARRALLAPVAEAIAVEAQTPLEVAALVTIGWHETRWARYVLEGRCTEGPPRARCDLDRRGRPRARGPWQVWAWCREAWSLPEGSPESLRAEASCALRAFRGGMARCSAVAHDVLAGAFSGYRGPSCGWSGATARAATLRRVHARLQRTGLP